LIELYLLNISGRPDRFFEDTRAKQEVLMKPVRSLPQVIEMLHRTVKMIFSILNHVKIKKDQLGLSTIFVENSDWSNANAKPE